MKNWDKTRMILIGFSIFVILIAFYVQSSLENKINELCSYLDPWIVDILAFIAALFLIIEGTFKIIIHGNANWKWQLSRVVRVAFGCAILTLHIMQFIHK